MVVELGGQLHGLHAVPREPRAQGDPTTLEPGVELIGAARLVTEIASATSRHADTP